MKSKEKLVLVGLTLSVLLSSCGATQYAAKWWCEFSATDIGVGYPYYSVPCFPIAIGYGNPGIGIRTSLGAFSGYFSNGNFNFIEYVPAQVYLVPYVRWSSEGLAKPITYVDLLVNEWGVMLWDGTKGSLVKAGVGALWQVPIGVGAEAGYYRLAFPGRTSSSIYVGFKLTVGAWKGIGVKEKLPPPPTYPDIYVRSWIDYGKQGGWLESRSKADLKIEVINNGDGGSRAIAFSIDVPIDLWGKVRFPTRFNVGGVRPGKSSVTTIPINANADLPTGTYELSVSGTEAAGNHVPDAKASLSTKYVEPEKPKFADLAVRASLDDSKGNGNGRLEASENAELKIDITNKGDAASSKVTLNIEVPPELKDVIRIQSRVGTSGIGPGETRTIPVPILALSDIPTGAYLISVFGTEEGGRALPSAVVTIATKETDTVVVNFDPGPKFPERTNTFALIIATNTYRDPGLSSGSLKYAEADARAAEMLLKNNGIANIYPLIGREATLSNINVKLAEIERMADEGSSVYIFFSGHGCTRLFVNDPKEPYFLPYDANPTNATSLAASSLSWAVLAASIQRMRTRNCVVALNACYGIRPEGSLAGPGTPEKPPATALNTGRVIISASASDQMAYEVKEYGMSLFFHHLLEGLKGKANSNGNSTVEADELFRYVRGRVAADAIRLKQTVQTPTAIPDGGVPIVITRCQ